MSAADDSTDDVPQDIDWEALWREFGFDTPGPDGSYIISRTQLTAAIESSEQGIPGDAASHIDRAIDEEDVQPVAEDRQGYVLPGVSGDE